VRWQRVQRVRPAALLPALDAVVDTSDLPQDLLQLAPDDGETAPPAIGQRVRAKSFSYSQITVTEPGEEPRDIGAKLTAGLVVSEGFNLAIPGFDAAFTIEVGAGEEGFDIEATMIEQDLSTLGSPPAGVENYPFCAKITANTFPISLKLNPDLFKPMESDGARYRPRTPGSDGKVEPAKLTLGPGISLIIRYTWEGGTDILLKTADGSAAFPEITVDAPVMMGDSGVILDIKSIIVDFSESESPPGAPDNEWYGVQFKKVAVAFQNGLDDDSGAPLKVTPEAPLGISLENLQIGTGGFSGRICGENLGLKIKLFEDMGFTLDNLCLGFNQNTISESEITGTIENLPFFENSPMKVALALDTSGNFKIGLADPNPSDDEPFIKLGIQGVLDFYVESAFFEHREGVLLVGLSGEIDPLFLGDVPGVDQTSDSQGRIAAKGFTVTSKGDVSLDGGWLTLPSKRYLDFRGFKVHLSQIGFGRSDPKGGAGAKNWIGFSGGVELVAGLGAAAEMKRLQFLWPANPNEDFAIDVKLDGIKVAYHQPNVVQFEGAVEWFETPGSASGDFATEGFAGKLNLNLLALNLSLNSRVVIGSAQDPGTAEDFKFFYLDLETQFPTGIPLAQTGVSLYGFLGMFSYSMAPNISEFENPVKWFNKYRVADNVLAGAPPTWRVHRGAVAFGAGVILGTAPDDGFTLNGKVALTISVPGPVVMFSGQANILKKRSSLSAPTEPLFVTLALFDGNANSFIINVGVFLDLAKVIKVSGEAEAFFDLDDPSDWHFYIGQKNPESRRVTANVLELFRASAYYMIDPDALAFGAKTHYGNRWKFGPLKVVLEAWFSYDAAISWRPIHAWGEAAVHGAVELSIFGFGLGLSVDARLALATPTPYLIEGEFSVKINLPWPLPDPKAKDHLKWESPGEKKPLDEVVTAVSLHTRKSEWVITPALDSDSTSNSAGPTAPLVNQVSMSQLSNPGDSTPEPGSSKAEAAIPLVPLDTFVGVRFARSVNDPDDIAFGNAYSSSKELRYRDVLKETIFQYDAVDYELVYGPQTSDPVILSSSPSDLYATWTAIPSTATREAHNSLDALSKNKFRYYSNTTFLGYDQDADDWVDWYAEHYALGLCLDQMDPDQQADLEQHYYDVSVRTKGGQSAMFAKLWHAALVGAGQVQLPCPVDLDYLDEEDFILPPYSVFRFTVDAKVHDQGSPPTINRQYRNNVLFYTEGPPLDLSDYVDVTVPESSDRPFYRGYSVSARFNESYMNKLYLESADQFLQVQVLDENENPVFNAEGVASDVETRWEQAADCRLDASEEAWYSLLDKLTSGAISSASLPKDDIVIGRVVDESAIRPEQRHIVRIWLQDPRLVNDKRLSDATWLERNPVRHVSKDKSRVVLYEYGFTASRYIRFSDFIGSFADSGGKWFALDLPDSVDVTSAIGPAMILNRPFRSAASGPVHNSDMEVIGVFLRHLLSPRTPGELTPEAFLNYVARTPGYAVGDPTSPSDTNGIEKLTDSQMVSIKDAWTRALEAYDHLDEALQLNRACEPLPEQIEVFVLTQSDPSSRRDGYMGFLVELPEAIDLSRVEIQVAKPRGDSYTPLVVPNNDSTRLLLFRVNASGVVPLDGVNSINFTFHRWLGDKNPRCFVRDGADQEVGTMEISIPDGEFQREDGV